MVRNPVFGTGFESFWVGPRLEKMTVSIDQTVNQAHNGYIEIFLNLGWTGVALLAGLLVSGYRRIVPAVRRQTQAGSLRLAYWLVALAYNFTEAGFKMMNPVWVVFLLSIAIVPHAPVLKRPKAGVKLRSEEVLVEPPGEVPCLTGPQAESPDSVALRRAEYVSNSFAQDTALDRLG
jgi:hypothetical protein